MTFTLHKPIPESCNIDSKSVVINVDISFYDCLLITLPQAIILNSIIDDATIYLVLPADQVVGTSYLMFVLDILRHNNIRFSVVSKNVIEDQPYVPGVAADITASSFRLFVDTVRDYLGIDNSPTGKRIYVSRSKSSRVFPGIEKPDIRVDDEDPIKEYLSSIGWSILDTDTMSISDQIRYVNGADMVMSLSGSGNLLGYFLKNNGTAIELMSTQIVYKPDPSGNFYLSEEIHHHHQSAALVLNNNYVAIPHDKTAKDIINKLKELAWIQS